MNIYYIRKAIQSLAINLDWWLMVADPLTCSNVGLGSKFLMSCWGSLLSVLMTVIAGVDNVRFWRKRSKLLQNTPITSIPDEGRKACPEL